MATIYTKSVSDKTLILAPREAVVRQFNFGTDWTEMRIGAFATGVTDSGDNTQSVNESVVISTAADRIAFGIKNNTTDLPGFAGSLFLGVVTPTGHDSAISGGLFFCGAAGLCGAGYHDTNLVGGTTAEDFGAPRAWGFGPAGDATGYNGFYAIKFVINNRGLSTQTITMSISSYEFYVISTTDYSASALRTALNNAPYSSTETIAWNDGAAARAIPDSVYLRMPFFNNRIRISAIRAIRYAP